MSGSLDGRRILITRPTGENDGLTAGLLSLGAEVIEVPTIEIEQLPIVVATRAAVAALDLADAVAFTSGNAVRVWVAILRAVGVPIATLQRASLFSVGPNTSDALHKYGLQPRVGPTVHSAKALAETMVDVLPVGATVIFPRSEGAKEVLPRVLVGAGVNLISLPIYRTICPPNLGSALRSAFGSGTIDLVVFASSSAVTNFVASLGGQDAIRSLAPIRVAALGPVTAGT
ncbi:MAG TPA: uroporphyrinogen-III synthase, partial [Candidatus Dormibacteraeota bacterium]|nr:uroporphyrinogen-III synthase [Candidatus Dormibacteraeota bacterium]